MLQHNSAGWYFLAVFIAFGSLKTPRYHGLEQSCDSPAGGRFIVLSLYFVVVKPQSCATCVTILLSCVSGCFT